MFSFFLVASLVLPGVLGHCCMPATMSAITYTAGQPTAYTLLADFNQNKYILRPSMGDQEYILVDLDKAESYTRFKDGSCNFGKDVLLFQRCVPESFVELGSSRLGESLTTNSFGARMGSTTLAVTVSAENCLPVVFTKNDGQQVTTRLYTNVTTPINDLTDLNQDISDCIISS